jgi:hypothetical protein
LTSLLIAVSSVLALLSNFCIALLGAMKRLAFILTPAILSSLLQSVAAFSPTRPNRLLRPQFPTLYAEDNANEVPPNGSWVLVNDFPVFLNQCALQSMVYLLNQLRDRQTAIWLELFAQPVIRKRTLQSSQDFLLSSMVNAAKEATKEKETPRQSQDIHLLTYHGLAIFNTTIFPTWASFYEKLLQEPSEEYTIVSEMKYVPDYDLEINPASLCSRIVSVREQIAREFVKDLHVIADMGGQTLESYWRRLKQQKDGDEGAQVERSNMLFLEASADPDNYDYAPSPLRKGNFDLLVLLATQESIHRVLNDASAEEKGSTDKASVRFLRNFYSIRIGTHFTGRQPYGRADDFLHELLDSSPSTVQIQDEEVQLVDPIRIAELILEQREKVATEWGDMAYEAPGTHTEIKRWQLNRLMGIDTTVENSFE